MNEEIKVSVVSWGPNRPLMMKWRDPISGKRRTKATDTYDWGEAERQAGEQENKLRAGLGVVPSRITWQEFLDRYQDEKLNWMKDTTRRAYLEAFHHVTRLLNPDRLAKLNTGRHNDTCRAIPKRGDDPHHDRQTPPESQGSIPVGTPSRLPGYGPADRYAEGQRTR